MEGDNLLSMLPSTIHPIDITTDPATVDPTRSPETQHFLSGNTSLKHTMESLGLLWFTSLSRLYFLADVMKAKGWDRALLVEGDNLLFAPLTTSRVAALSAEYTGVALCPQSNLYVTASVMWVASHRVMVKMLTRIIDILENPGRFIHFCF